MFGLGKKKALPTDHHTSLIVPRIKRADYIDALKRHNVSDEMMPLYETLVGDLILTYAYDLEGRFEMISNISIAKYGLVPTNLRAIALANLPHRLPQLATIGKPPFMVMTTGNDMEATTILLTDFWDRIAAQMPGELVIAVIQQEYVFVTNSEEEKLLNHALDSIEEAQRDNPDRALSRHLYAWRNSRWEIFEMI